MEEMIYPIVAGIVALAFVISCAVLLHTNIEATNKTSVACIEQGKEWNGFCKEIED